MIRALKNFVENNNREAEEIRLYFNKCAADIDRSNLYMLRRACMYTSIVFVCMLFFATIAIPGFNVTIGHYLMLVLLMVYFFVNMYTRNHSNISTLATALLCLIFYFSVAFNFILMEMFSAIDSRTRWLPLLLMCFPVLFIDRQYKYCFEETILVIIYAVVSASFKEPAAFSRDLYTMIAAYVLSLLTARIILGLRSKQGLAMAELRKYSSIDKLTNVYNKGALLAEIDSCLATREQGDPCAMCIIDVDNFKQVNDSLGHTGGDMLLEHIGQILLSSFRSVDIIGRFGGDEFVVFMPGMKDASLVEFRCRTAQMMLADFHIGNDTPFSLSIGTIIDEGSHSREELFKMADDALYKSKMEGKNCCTSWSALEKEHSPLPVLIFAPSYTVEGAETLKRNEKDRFKIFSEKNNDDIIRYVSQYDKHVKLVVVEVDDSTKAGEFIIQYVKGRERFGSIPVLAVVRDKEGETAALEMGADSVIYTEEADERFAEKISEMSGLSLK